MLLSVDAGPHPGNQVAFDPSGTYKYRSVKCDIRRSTTILSDEASNPQCVICKYRPKVQRIHQHKAALKTGAKILHKGQINTLYTIITVCSVIRRINRGIIF